MLSQRTRDYQGKLKGPHTSTYIIVRLNYISCNVYISSRCHIEVRLSSKSSDLVINSLDNTMSLRKTGTDGDSQYAFIMQHEGEEIMFFGNI